MKPAVWQTFLRIDTIVDYFFTGTALLRQSATKTIVLRDSSLFNYVLLLVIEYLNCFQLH